MAENEEKKTDWFSWIIIIFIILSTVGVIVLVLGVGYYAKFNFLAAPKFVGAAIGQGAANVLNYFNGGNATVSPTGNINVPLRQQQSSWGCGLNSIEMMAEAHGGGVINFNEFNYKEDVRLSDFAQTALPGWKMDWVDVPGGIGARPQSEWNDIRNLVNQGDPVLLHVLGENSGNHYVVVVGFNENKAIINDPATGTQREININDSFFYYPLNMTVPDSYGHYIKM